MIDILPPLNKRWGEFRKRMAEKGIENYRALSVDIMHSKCQGFDVTHSSGILYHCPNPIQYLQALRSVTREHCIMTTASIPYKIQNSAGVLELTGGEVMFVPTMTDMQKAVFTEHYVRKNRSPIWGINKPYKFDDTDYTPWWWLFTETALVGMAESAGWVVEDVRPNWGGRAHTMLLKNSGRVDGVTVG